MLELRDVVTNIKAYEGWDYRNYPLTKEEAEVILIYAGVLLYIKENSTIHKIGEENNDREE